MFDIIPFLSMHTGSLRFILISTATYFKFSITRRHDKAAGWQLYAKVASSTTSWDLGVFGFGVFELRAGVVFI